MHVSNFLLIEKNDEKITQELSLSADVSEWLFSIGFWNDINKTQGTFFDQYEEEYVSTPIATTIAGLLFLKIKALDMMPNNDVRFRYGWNEKKEELFCEIEKEKIKEELVKLAELFSIVKTIDMGVYCQL